MVTMMCLEGEEVGIMQFLGTIYERAMLRIQCSTFSRNPVHGVHSTHELLSLAI